MVIVVRDSNTEILKNVEYITGVVREFPPNFAKARKVTGFGWDWEVPTEETIWAYGMTDKEFKQVKKHV